MAAIFPKEGRSNVLQHVAGAGGVNLYVNLSKNLPAINADTVYSDFALADYDGYAPFNSAAWSDPQTDTNGDEFILSPVIVFQKSPGIVTNTIYAYIVTIGTGGAAKMIECEALGAPIPMVAPSDQVPLRLKISTRNLTS